MYYFLLCFVQIELLPHKKKSPERGRENYEKIKPISSIKYFLQCVKIK